MLPALQVYFYSTAVLLIVYISLRKSSDSQRFNTRIFKSLVLILISLMVVDFLHIIFDGKSGQLNRLTLVWLSVVLYIIAPLVSMLWFYYIDDFINKNTASLQRFRKWVLTLFILNAVLSFASIFVDLFFVIDATNTYVRGRFFLLHAFVIYFYLILASINLIANRKQIRPSAFWPMLLFAILPAIAGVFQTLIYGLLLIWPFASLSLLMVFVFVQSQRISTDYLTGLYNKLELDYYLRSLAKINFADRYLAGIALDLDGFKSINDTYGHPLGDEVLKDVSTVLSKSGSPNDFIARVGGDEFIILILTRQVENVNLTLEAIHHNLHLLNVTKKYPFEIKISFGSTLYDPKIHQSLQDFIDQLDHSMYQDKRQS